jgi:NAD(P)H-flavin reductase
MPAWRRAGLDIHLTVDQGTARWRGDVGLVTRLISRAALDPANAVALVCGPEVMMRFTAVELGRLGLAPEAIHLSMERNMKCAIGHCGHCQFGPLFLCREGPVVPYRRVADLLKTREV